MAEKLLLLSEDDRRKIQESINRVRSISIRSVGRETDEVVNQSTEVHIAKTPAGGIPALAVVGSSTRPGYADCDIYTIIDDPASNPYIELIDDAEERVYNLSTSSISGNSWILITKDKFGNWISTDLALTNVGVTEEWVGVSELTQSGDIYIGYRYTWSIPLGDWQQQEAVYIVIIGFSFSDYVPHTLRVGGKYRGVLISSGHYYLPMYAVESVHTEVVSVTGVLDEANGLYYGKVQTFDPDTDTFANYGSPIILKEINNTVLEPEWSGGPWDWGDWDE